VQALPPGGAGQLSLRWPLRSTPRIITHKATSQKVSAYAALIAEAMGMKDAEVEEVRLGAVLHDIGKVGVPESILNKNGPLNPEEWETMKAHANLARRSSIR